GLGWSVFMLGATYGHIYQTLHEGNYAPYNFLTIFSDGFIAVWFWCCCTCTAAGENFRSETEAAGESSPVTVRLRVHEPRRASRELPQLSESGQVGRHVGMSALCHQRTYATQQK